MTKKNKSEKQLAVKESTAEIAPNPPQAVDKSFDDGFTNLQSTFVNSGYHPSDTGTPVGPISAMQISTCYACVKRLSEDVGRLPLYLYENLKPSGKQIVTDSDIVDLLDDPNPWMTREELITYLVYSLVLEGNGYCFVQRDHAGNAIRLIPVSPYQMQPIIDQTGTGDVYYRFTSSLYPADLFACASEDMIHIKNSITTPSGVTGLSPIFLGQQVLGIGVATQKSAAVLFANGAQLRGFLSCTGTLSPESAKSLGEGWKQAYTAAANAGKTAILDSGTTFVPINQKADESQLLESRKFSVEEIARWFGVPTVKIGEMGRANFSNVVELNKSYIQDTLIPICTKIEGAFRKKLFNKSDRRKYFFRFDFSEMLRANDLERMQANQIARLSGILTQNEIRSKEHLNPVPGGDTFLIPLNMTLTGKPDAAEPLGTEPLPNPQAEPSSNQEEDDED